MTNIDNQILEETIEECFDVISDLGRLSNPPLMEIAQMNLVIQSLQSKQQQQQS